MDAKTTALPVQWQDLKVKSELDTIFEIAQQRGWKDCEIFGYGEMILQPMESMGWKLIPADVYEYSIPAAGVDRVLQVINAGIQIKGVIIADDLQKAMPLRAPLTNRDSQPSSETLINLFLKAAAGLIMIAGAIMFAPLLFLGIIASVVFDPKLIILVDDGNGNTVWVSILTWYEK